MPNSFSAARRSSYCAILCTGKCYLIEISGVVHDHMSSYMVVLNYISLVFAHWHVVVDLTQKLDANLISR